MAYFAVHYTYADQPSELDRVRPDHRAFLGRLAEQGVVVASGPYLGVTPASALLIMRAADAETLATTLNQDPFWSAGLIAEREITEWNPVIGILAGSL